MTSSPPWRSAAIYPNDAQRELRIRLGNFARLDLMTARGRTIGPEPTSPQMFHAAEETHLGAATPALRGNAVEQEPILPSHLRSFLSFRVGRGGGTKEKGGVTVSACSDYTFMSIY